MIAEPKLEDLIEQHYVGIRTQAKMKELNVVIPQLLGEVIAWLGKQGVAPAGAPFIRFHVINMKSKLDIELGWPGANALMGNRGCDSSGGRSTSVRGCLQQLIGPGARSRRSCRAQGHQCKFSEVGGHVAQLGRAVTSKFMQR